MKTIRLIIKEHIIWRSQILKLAKADIIKTYSGAALGWSWAVIKPSVTIFIYWFAFSMGMKSKAGIEGFQFFPWMIAGMIPWFFISDMWASGPKCMRRYRFLITKMKFPTSTIPTFIALSKLAIHICLMAAVVVIYCLYGYYPTIYYIQLPVYMLLMLLMAVGWGLFSSVLGAMSQDFGNLVTAISQALFWFSGILIPFTNFGNGIMRILFNLNPITYIVEGYRNCFVHKVWFFHEWHLLLVFLVELAIMWALGAWAFRKLRKEMPDVL